MIIQCEKCRSKFNLDESLLNKDGSKVRCSLCKHTFVAYPPGQIGAGEVAGPLESREEPPARKEAAAPPPRAVEPGASAPQEEFDILFEEPIEELEEFEPAGAGAPMEGAAAEEEPPGRPVPDRRGKGAGRDIGLTVAGRPKKTRRKSRFLLVFLLIVLVLAGGAGGVHFLAPELIDEYMPILRPQQPQGITDLGISRLSFHAVSGSFVDSPKAGNLFVIRGVVRNDYPTSRSFILIRGSILDEKGQVIRRQSAYAGNVLKKEEVKVLSMEEIEKAMKNRQGTDGRNANVLPGASIPFMVVFENLPENVSEFTVEALRSSPGT